MNLSDLKKLRKKLVALSLIGTLGVGAAPINTAKVSAKSIHEVIDKVEDISGYYNDVNNTINACTSYYSKVFNLKEEILENEVKKLEIYKEYKYNQYNDFSKEDIKIIERTIIDTAFSLYYKPSSLGYKNRNEISNGKNYESTLSTIEMNAKYSYIYDNERNIQLSIMCCECGKEKNSHNYRVNNNPGGIGGNMKFPNKEVGMIYFSRMLSYNYHLELDSDESFLNRVASTYCAIPEHWLSLTRPCYRAIKKNYFVYDPELEGEIDLSIYENDVKPVYTKK